MTISSEPDDATASHEAMFNQLYQKHSGRLVGWARRRLDSESEAEDVIQETFLAAYQSLGNYRGEGRLESWIFGVARNVLRQRGRRSAAAKRFAIRTDDDVDGGCEDSMRVHPMDEELFVEQFESIARAQLGDDEWRLLMDRHVGERSIEELSSERTESVEAVKSRLYRARQRLWEHYTEACSEVG